MSPHFLYLCGIRKALDLKNVVEFEFLIPE